jgi:hypothetical protein
MAGVEDGGQAHTRFEGLDQDVVHLVVYDVTGRFVVDGVDDLVVAIFFVSVEVAGLTSVA